VEVNGVSSLEDMIDDMWNDAGMLAPAEADVFGLSFPDRRNCHRNPWCKQYASMVRLCRRDILSN
jgi:hypothetical protein